MEDDIGSFQPWQIFSGLYLCFWVVSAYFDHFLMTFVFCIAFGVFSEIATKYMSGEQASVKKELDSLVSLAQSEATLVPSLTNMAKQEAKARSTEEDELMAASQREERWESELVAGGAEKAGGAEDECPPPLPAKDYMSTVDHTMEAVKDRISQVLESKEDATAAEEAGAGGDVEEILISLTDHDADNEEENVAGKGVEVSGNSAGVSGNSAGDYEDFQNVSGGTASQEMTAEVLQHVSDGHCPVISEIGHQDNSSKENIRSMSEVQEVRLQNDGNHSDKPGQQINLFSTRVQDDDDEDEGVEDDEEVEEEELVDVSGPLKGLSDKVQKDLDNALLGETQSQTKPLFPAYSISDEELEEEYAKREVNLEESESEDDEYEYKSGRMVQDDIAKDLQKNPPNNEQNAAIFSLGDDDEADTTAALKSDKKEEIEQVGEIKGDKVEEEDSADSGSKGAKGAMAALENPSILHSMSNSESFPDLDLSDPQLEQAATKIQSVFKGFRARKNMTTS